MSKLALKIGYILLAALTPSIGLPAAAHENPFPEIKNWYFPQSNILERDFGSIATCGALQQAYDVNGWPKGVSLESLRAIDTRLKKSVFLRPDQGPDTWTPLTSTVIEGKRKPAADCDDVAVTGAQLAVCAGFPADGLGLLVTQLPARQNELHVVAFYSDPQNGVWIFGDTMGRPRAFSKLGQELHYYAFIDDITTWWAMRDPRTGKVLTGGGATSSIPDATESSDPDATTCKHLHKSF